jgi:hypothetical protein
MHAPWGIPTCAGNGTFHYLKYTAYHISSGSGGGWGGSGGGWDCGAAILNPVYKMAPCVGRLTAGMRCTVGMVGH